MNPENYYNAFQPSNNFVPVSNNGNYYYQPGYNMNMNGGAPFNHAPNNFAMNGGYNNYNHMNVQRMYRPMNPEIDNHDSQPGLLDDFPEVVRHRNNLNNQAFERPVQIYNPAQNAVFYGAHNNFGNEMYNYQNNMHMPNYQAMNNMNEHFQRPFANLENLLKDGKNNVNFVVNRVRSNVDQNLFEVFDFFNEQSLSILAENRNGSRLIDQEIKDFLNEFGKPKANINAPAAGNIALNARNNREIGPNADPEPRIANSAEITNKLSVAPEDAAQKINSKNMSEVNNIDATRNAQENHSDKICVLAEKQQTPAMENNFQNTVNVNNNMEFKCAEKSTVAPMQETLTLENKHNTSLIVKPNEKEINEPKGQSDENQLKEVKGSHQLINCKESQLIEEENQQKKGGNGNQMIKAMEKKQLDEQMMGANDKPEKVKEENLKEEVEQNGAEGPRIAKMFAKDKIVFLAWQNIVSRKVTRKRRITTEQAAINEILSGADETNDTDSPLIKKRKIDGGNEMANIAQVVVQTRAEIGAEPRAQFKAETRAQIRAPFQAKTLAQIRAFAAIQPRNQSRAQLRDQIHAQNRARTRAQTLAQNHANTRVQNSAQTRAQNCAQTRAQTSAQIRAQNHAQTRAQNRAQTGAHNRSQTGAQNRTQIGAQNRAQAGAQNRAQTGAQKRAQAGAKNRAQTGAQNRAQAGAQNRAQAGTQNRAQTGAKNCAQARVQNRAQTGAQNRTQAGAQNSAQSGAKNRAQTGAQKRTQTAAKNRAQTGAQKRTQTAAQNRAQTGAQYRAQTGAQNRAQTRAQNRTLTRAQLRGLPY